MKTPFFASKFILVALLIVSGLFGLWALSHRVPDVADARHALRQGRFEEAIEIADSILPSSENSTDALRVACLASLETGRIQDAVRYARQLPPQKNVSLDAFQRAARRAMETSRLSDAETLFREILRLSPAEVHAHRQLATILNATGRRWDAAVHGRSCIAAKQFTLGELLLWGNPEEPYVDAGILPSAQKSHPTDPAVRLAEALASLLKGQTNIPLTTVARLLQEYDSGMEPNAVLGNAFLDRGDLEGFRLWNEALPADADLHSEIWFVRGRFAQMTEQRNAAVRCYWETCLREPFHRRANFQLGQQLAALGENEEARPFLERAERLAELHQTMRPVYFDGATSDVLLRIVNQLESLERYNEANAWCFAASQLFPNEETIQLRFRKLEADSEQRQRSGTPADAVPVIAADLSRFSLPEWSVPTLPSKPAFALESQEMRFSDVARNTGISFQYFNSDDPTTRGKRIFETTGGGVAVADFDGNGWPDLYFTQGCRWPVDSQQTEFRDHCYFNNGRGQFFEITSTSGLLEYSYSQGASAGDLDNDGFPDLYIANIGQNRLFLNNGDGTFSPESSPVLEDDSWTTSCVIADLNEDGNPDLFDANYLSDRTTYERGCGTEDPDECSPAAFRSAQSRVYLSRGDGLWSDGTDLTGLRRIVGKALGVVVFRTEPDTAPTLFVANDGEANFWFRPNFQSPREYVYQESGVFSGLAFDGNGRAQASMGIAAGDADGDGRLDLFVTNFYQESNTFYRQQPGNLFVDDTRRAELTTPGFLKLGFGTQFADLNLDGRQDLVLVNGHVVDRSHKGEENHMAPQCFVNVGDCRFAEVFPSGSPPYFSGKYLGRGMAKVDWNRDGLEDFAVSHLDSPAALVTNEWSGTNHRIALSLVGIQSSRDAIGAIVTLVAGGEKQTLQLTAGDGYQASNQRLLNFGLGEQRVADEILIRWPSGESQTLRNVPSGAQLKILEGRSAQYSVSVR